MNKTTIICIDDEMMILKSLKSQLKKHLGMNAIVETANSADEGLELLDELDQGNNQIVVIVSDYLMPGMKGDEFLLTARNRHPKIESIMLSGEIPDEAAKNARENLNLVALVAKPWDEFQFLEIVKKAILNAEIKQK